MIDIPITHVFLISALLFCVGFIGVLARRNTLFMLMSLEVMLNAVGLAFVGAGSLWQQADGQIMFILILTLAAAEVAIGLALLIRMQHQRQNVDVDGLSQLRG
ncbi:NADH-quinone oxidoreductase subunit NuoK [Thalassotalea sp. PS06]|uniref:NADH-quinone oxidoreductase subunit NuoK n=1 Tax=Thalassotalea sp. PS06 TaxID=2594005 RepID=UPI001164011E|nr:NADH-quinone oxidoreductase subunit NuoK [Thalassotalea sp. PS06]QDP00860.1 NADH-quinone oxidoreductase subunit NuoK [Thalassotalea sp. PS06]